MWLSFVLIITSSIIHIYGVHDNNNDNKVCKILEKFNTCFYGSVVKVNSGNNITIKDDATNNILTLILSGIKLPSLKHYQLKTKNYLKRILHHKSAIRVVSTGNITLDRNVTGILYSRGYNINKKLLVKGYACFDKSGPKYYIKYLVKARKLKRGFWKKSSFKCSTFSRYINKRIKVIVKRVIDGDTIHVIRNDSSSNNTRLIKVRLTYIDAPEYKQNYGIISTNYLKQLLASKKEIYLERKSIDVYNRVLGVIFVGDEDVNKKMVEAGFAWCYRMTKCPLTYQQLMKDAKKAKRGLFVQTNPIEPWNWRKEHRF